MTSLPLKKSPIILSEVKSFSFQHGKIIGYTGSIFKRRIKAPVKPYWHYALFYGFDKNGKLLLVENNESGVRQIYWKDFVSEQEKWELSHVELDLKNQKNILERVRERSLHSYHASNNNCEHFVNYCLFGKLESHQVEITKQIINIPLLVLEALSISAPKVNLKMLEVIDGMRKADYVKISRGDSDLDDFVNSLIPSSKNKV